MDQPDDFPAGKPRRRGRPRADDARQTQRLPIGRSRVGGSDAVGQRHDVVEAGSVVVDVLDGHQVRRA